MEIRGDKLTDKENAGAALMDALKEVKGLEPVPIGTYRGFAMSVTLENFGHDYVLTLKGQMTYRAELGKDPRGNLTRIENALNGLDKRLETAKSELENLYTQIDNANAEVNKPFPQEEELKEKSARLAELNAELNIDERSAIERMADDGTERGGSDRVTAKAERPSVLSKLRAMKEVPKEPVSPAKHQEKETR